MGDPTATVEFHIYRYAEVVHAIGPANLYEHGGIQSRKSPGTFWKCVTVTGNLVPTPPQVFRTDGEFEAWVQFLRDSGLSVSERVSANDGETT